MQHHATQFGNIEAIRLTQGAVCARASWTTGADPISVSTDPAAGPIHPRDLRHVLPRDGSFTSGRFPAQLRVCDRQPVRPTALSADATGASNLANSAFARTELVASWLALKLIVVLPDDFSQLSEQQLVASHRLGS
jgi:hypothetical protein